MRFLWADLHFFLGIRLIFPRGTLVLRHMNKRFGLLLVSLLLTAFVVGCGPLTGKSDTPQASQPSSETLMNQGNPGTAQSGGALAVPAPVALPPSYDDRPAQPGETKTTTMPNGMPALQPKGVNVSNLFAEKVTDTDRRFTRLENAVQGLRSEFESFKPAIVRLVAVESDIQDLIKQLDMLLQNEPAAAPPPQPMSPPTQLSPADQAPPPMAASQPTSSPQPTMSAGGASVITAMRVGTHSDKIRLVMDASKKTPFNVDFDNQENLLIIELPQARWNAARQQSFARSPVLQSYSVEDINNGQGSRVIMTLKKSTQILKQQALPPGSNPNYRIYLDLSK